jgi:oligo-1,6-glucosidase
VSTVKQKGPNTMTANTTPITRHALREERDTWWKHAVVYQIYPRSFADASGDGIGDLRGIIGKLDYLHELGVDVIWLSPVYTSPQDDNGYDISDYQDIDPMFGSLDDFDELMHETATRSIKVVMDLVVNHTSDEHPWFVESRSSQESPKRDWYWWRPARDGMEPNTAGAEPTNWQSFFSEPAWSFDEASEEYYLHLFSRKQPDLNWENPAVRHAVYDMMNWWLDRGVDGFRMDVINMLSKDTSLPDGQPTGHGTLGDGSPYYLSGPRIHEFLQEMYREVFEGRNALLTVGEMPGVTIDQARLYTDPARKELDMVFQFEHVQLDHGERKYEPRALKLTDLKASLGRWQAGLADAGWNSLYWNNHDQPRVVSRFGDDGACRVESAKMLATVLHLHRGTPYIYQGEEIGMTNMPFDSLDDFQDIASVNHAKAALGQGVDASEVLAAMRYFSRDNARSPVQWDAGDQAGFTNGTPWFPVNPNYTEINIEAARSDEHSIYHHYRRLIALRHEHPVIALGDFEMLLERDPTVYAFTRSLDDVTLLVLGNFSDDVAPVDLPDAASWAEEELLIGNYPSPGVMSGITLRPWETRVYMRA